MKIEQFQLENVGPFRSLSMPLAPDVTVLIGNNGAGKTTLLRSLATSLSWLVARVRNEKGSGSAIDEEQILNGANSASIFVTARDHEVVYEWTLAKMRAGRKSTHASQLSNVSRLADVYRSALSQDEQANVPLVAFYPVERAVLDIPLKIKEKHSFQQLALSERPPTHGRPYRHHELHAGLWQIESPPQAPAVHVDRQGQ